MPPKSKGITSHFPLKMTPSERAVVEFLRMELEEAGIEASLNDVIRHRIRVAEFPPVFTVEAARAATQEHWRICEVCGPLRPAACPDGFWLFRRQLEARRALGEVGADGPERL